MSALDSTAALDIYNRTHVGAFFDLAFKYFHLVHPRLTLLLRIEYSGTEITTNNLAYVTDLAAAFSVERRAI